MAAIMLNNIKTTTNHSWQSLNSKIVNVIRYWSELWSLIINKWIHILDQLLFDQSVSSGTCVRVSYCSEGWWPGEETVCHLGSGDTIAPKPEHKREKSVWGDEVFIHDVDCLTDAGCAEDDVDTLLLFSGGFLFISIFFTVRA